jgi:hypothetical protein
MVAQDAELLHHPALAVLHLAFGGFDLQKAYPAIRAENGQVWKAGTHPIRFHCRDLFEARSAVASK